MFAAGELEGDAATAVAEQLGGCDPFRERAVDDRTLRGVDVCSGPGAVRWHRFRVPFGTLRVAASDEGLVRLSWQEASDDAFAAELRRRFPDRPVVRDRGSLAGAERQLREYFAGDRTAFDLPVDLSSLADFDRRVLRAARRLSHGEVSSYGSLAREIGRPRAARAVGNALGRNPVAIVVPCHRVIRSDGSVGGYGGGIERKVALLRLEGREDLLRAD